jgi:hypothetical protein
MKTMIRIGDIYKNSWDRYILITGFDRPAGKHQFDDAIVLATIFTKDGMETNQNFIKYSTALGKESWSVRKFRASVADGGLRKIA